MHCNWTLDWIMHVLGSRHRRHKNMEQKTLSSIITGVHVEKGHRIWNQGPQLIEYVFGIPAIPIVKICYYEKRISNLSVKEVNSIFATMYY